jgi:hypothetical protein
MRASPGLLVVLSLATIACRRSAEELDRETTAAAADSPAASTGRAPVASTDPTPRPADSAAGLAAGKEPGTIPATPTPTITSESAIAAMRAQLQRLDTASVQALAGARAEHSKMLGDLLTTMRVEVQALTSTAKDSWLAMADSAEGDLNRLALADGEALRTAFRVHRDRVLRLLDDFRVLVPRKS